VVPGQKAFYCSVGKVFSTIVPQPSTSQVGILSSQNSYYYGIAAKFSSLDDIPIELKSTEAEGPESLLLEARSALAKMFITSIAVTLVVIAVFLSQAISLRLPTGATIAAKRVQFLPRECHSSGCRRSSFPLYAQLQRNISPRRIARPKAGVKVSTAKLLCAMITARFQGDGLGFQFKDAQIEEKIRQFKIKLSFPDPESGLLPLRYAIRMGRRDVCRILLKHGASASAIDRNGMILYEALETDRPGSLHLLTGKITLT
jgi:hypothetical protein